MKRKVRPVCFYDMDAPTPIRTLCGQYLEDVRWTTGWRVSDNPPYNERREKVTCKFCLEKMLKQGITVCR